jgi:hypothetical protein
MKIVFSSFQVVIIESFDADCPWRVTRAHINIQKLLLKGIGRVPNGQAPTYYFNEQLLGLDGYA